MSAALQQPTFFFIGVTTGSSSINAIFPRWMTIFGRPDVALVGVDHPLHDAPEAYRATVARIRHDPLAVGGLVTTHKLDLFAAARDLIDEIDPYAELTHEVSCLSKQGGRLVGHALDPVSSGLTLAGLLGPGYFGRSGGELLCFGAGGAAAATLLYLLRRPDAADRPARATFVDRSPARLAHLRGLAERVGGAIEIAYLLGEDARQNDALLAGLPDGSLVINATGMGKDTPGSPVSDAGVFPRGGVAWEFNYRGELGFLRQAERQRDSRGLTVADGWEYFVHGWSQVVAQVLHVPLTDELFARLSAAARA